MIVIYDKSATDFTNNGLGTLEPISCVVTETINGNYEVVLTHPIDEKGKFSRIQEERIIKVPVPAGKTPIIRVSGEAEKGHSIYKVVTDGRRLYLRAGPSQSAKGLKTYEPGTEVVVIDNTTNSQWSEVTTPDGRHGWMWTGNLEFVRIESSGAEAEGEIKEADALREQPFRIYKVEPTLTGITAYARHIFYDLMDNMVASFEPDANTSGAAAFRGLSSATTDGHEFTFYSDLESTAEDVEIIDKNPAEAILDDGGLIEHYGGELQRDWWDVYLAKRIGEERDIQIREGKNLLGIKYSVDITNAVTRVIPKGADEDGNPLYLPGRYRENEAEDKPVYVNHKYSVIEVKEAKIKTKGEDKRTEAECMELMEKAAKEAFEAGCDLPDVTLNVDFIDCAETEEYRQYRNLQGIHMGDTVKVIAKRVGVEVAMRMTQYSYDCLTKKYIKMTLGTVDATIEGNMINPRSIGSGTISGSMIKLNSIGTGQIMDGAVNGLKIALAAIDYAHIGTAAIDQLAVNAVTAIRADIRELVAGNITTDQLYADIAVIAAAQITAANIDKANIKWAEIESLTAEIAKIVNAEIGHAEIDTAQIKNLSAAVATIVKAEIAIAEIDWARIKNVEVDTAQIKLGAITQALIAAGAIGTAQIADGSITEAKIVSLNADVITSGTLSTERLLIKGEGGLFYEINATAGGLTAAQLTEEQYKNAISGTALVARSVTADKIAAKSITSNEILSGTITAAEINVANLFAAEATIAALDSYIMRTTTIEALKGSLDIWASDKIRIAVDNLQIGGTNMVRLADGCIAFQDSNGAVARDWPKTHYCQSGIGMGMYPPKEPYNLLHFTAPMAVAPGEYILSFWSWLGGDTDIQPTIQCNLFSSSAGVDHYFGSCQPPKYTPTRYVMPITVDYTAEVTLRILCFTPSFTTGQVYFTDFKLEKGTKATDWSPAPEDTDAAIESLSAELTVQAGDITANATKIETVNQAAANAQSAANAAQGTANSAQNTANAAQSAANAAQGTANSAQNTANAAQSAANAAQSTANGAVTRVTTAEGRISAVEGSISSMVTEEEFNELGEKVSANSSAITQTATEIRSEVAGSVSGLQTQIEQTDEQVLILAGRKSGGTNLVRFHTIDFAAVVGNTVYTDYGVWADVDETWYYRSRKMIALSPFTGDYTMVQFFGIPLKEGTQYTASFNMWHGAGGSGITLMPNIWNEGRGVDLGFAGQISVVANTPTRYELTFTCPVTDTYRFRLISFGGNNAVIYLSDVKLEEGNTATAWSAHPEEYRAGSNVSITEKEVRIVSPTTFIGIPASDGETMVAQFDENGMTANVITASNIAYRYTGPAEVWINPGTSAASDSVYRSLADLFAQLRGRYLDMSGLTVHMQGNDYGVMSLQRVVGGAITIYGNGVTLTGGLAIEDCTTRVYVNDLNIVANGVNQAAWVIGRAAWVQWHGCTFNGNGAGYGLYLGEGGSGMVWDCGFYNATNLLYAGHASDASVIGTYGGNGTNFAATDGCTIKFSGTRPDGAWAQHNVSLVAPNDPSTLGINYGSAQPSIPPISTAAWNYLYSDSYARGWSAFADEDVRQGYNGQTIYGVIWFDASAIRSTLSSKTINQASLRLHMHKGVGRGVAVSVQLYGSDISYDRTAAPGLVTSYGTIGTTEPGVVNEITIPTQVITDIVNGTIQALVLKSDDAELYKDRGYSRNYARFSGSTSATAENCPRLTVVYQ